MNHYFRLQFLIVTRGIRETGIHPLIIILIAIALFLTASHILFNRVEYAWLIYSALALSTTLRLSRFKRNELMRILFNQSRYRIIRMTENILMVTPFNLYMIVNGYLAQALILTLFAALTSIWSPKMTSYTLPTPFGRIPFEFASGFRASFLLFLIAICLLVAGSVYANFNLSVSSILLISVTCFFYYLNAEDEYLVWIFKKDPPGFLLHKFTSAFIYFSTSNFIPLTVLAVSFPENIMISFGVYLAGLIYLLLIILAKYASFPSDLNIPYGLLFGFTIFFPPFILLSFPYLYIRSKQKLSDFLYDQNK